MRVCKDNNRNPHWGKRWLLCTGAQTPRTGVSAPSIQPGGPCFHALPFIGPQSMVPAPCQALRGVQLPPNTCESTLQGWEQGQGLDSPLYLLRCCLNFPQKRAVMSPFSKTTGSHETWCVFREVRRSLRLVTRTHYKMLLLLFCLFVFFYI